MHHLLLSSLAGNPARLPTQQLWAAAARCTASAACGASQQALAVPPGEAVGTGCVSVCLAVQQQFDGVTAAHCSRCLQTLRDRREAAGSRAVLLSTSPAAAAVTNLACIHTVCWCLSLLTLHRALSAAPTPTTRTRDDATRAAAPAGVEQQHAAAVSAAPPPAASPASPFTERQGPPHLLRARTASSSSPAAAAAGPGCC